MDNSENLDKLYEALTLEVDYAHPVTPKFQGYGRHPEYWNYYGQTWPVGQFHGGRNGKRVLHKDIIYYDENGSRHRVYGPAYVSKLFDIEIWYIHGVMHRDGGPAYTHKHNMVWYNHGVLHRLDGPAVIEGGGPKQYWINGCKMSEKEYKKQIKSMTKRGKINGGTNINK